MLVYDVQGIIKQYPGQAEPANKHISLQIAEGEIFGLLGDNGAGKTTLVRQMANLLRSDAGSILLFGQDIALDPLLVPRCVGYMPQDGRALNSLTVGEALYFTAHLRGMSRAEAQKNAVMLLERWQIEHLRHKPTSRLSGGERRLMQLAVAMAGTPPVLMLDEPTNDLDPQRRRLVWEQLRRYNIERGATVIFITHDALEAEKVIQRVGILRQGELVALGRPSELKQVVDRKLRLELFFAPEAPPALPPELTITPLEAGRWLVSLEWQHLDATLDALKQARLDDFRLYSATLEDLYLHYASHSDTSHRDAASPA
ncbi:MAG TPA: ABC transporter ATP-binding protein [Ktedonobacterales bacterium]|jgi:ABC-type multidrug transport system ATPase subunit